MKHPLRIARLLIFLICGLMTIDSALAQERTSTEADDPTIVMNRELTGLMLDTNQNLRKVENLLISRKNEVFETGQFVVGASLIALADYQKATDDSKFGYLMRHPTASNQIGDVVTEAVLHSFQLGMTGGVTDWMTVYGEMLYDPQQSFGAGTITALGRNQFQLRKGYVLLGDLNRYPVFLALGKMDTPFGQMDSVSPFTNSTAWHAFGGLGYGAHVGLETEYFSAGFMAVQGGSQFRALNTPVGDTTNVPSKINNFVADANIHGSLQDMFDVRIGASYMHGSAYCHSFPVFHFEPCPEANPAMSVYGSVVFQDRVKVKGGYSVTSDEWPGTFNPTPPLNEFSASKVSSLDAGIPIGVGSYKGSDLMLSGEFSNFVAGPDGSPWERQNQIIVGFCAMVNGYTRLFVEYFNVDGYAPLNFISGSRAFEPFPPGTTHSKADADSFGFIIGTTVTI